jgi:anti-anti-sigma regulatory factor
MSTLESPAWIESRRAGDVMILKLRPSHLDREEHPRREYDGVIDAAIAAGCRRVILDLSNLRDTNHTWGLFQVIFVANRKVKEVGGRVVVCGMRRYIRSVFRIADLDRFIPAYKSEAQALDALARATTT